VPINTGVGTWEIGMGIPADNPYACTTPSAYGVIYNLCIMKNSCRIPAQNLTLGDGCPGRNKNLFVEAICGLPTSPTPTVSATSAPTQALTSVYKVLQVIHAIFISYQLLFNTAICGFSFCHGLCIILCHFR
jgi:hypothetical protein